MRYTFRAYQKRILIQFLLFLCVNGLFVLKYAARTSLNPILCLFVYLLLVNLLFFFYKKIIGSKKSQKKVNVFFVVNIVVVLIGISYFHYVVNPYDLMVDRWSALHNFIQKLFQGIYPYSAQTHLDGYGSPFPVWQLFHIPFYLLGNVAFGMSFVLLVFLFISFRFVKNNLSLSSFLFLLTLSPAFWYEVIVRSDLFYNFLLILAVLIFINVKKHTLEKKTLMLGVICGLFLSTRLAAAIPFFIYFFPEFLKSSWKQRVSFVTIILIVFIVSFVPFIIWDPQSLLFFDYNPFVLQSRQGSWVEILFIVIFSMFFSLKWRGDFICFSEYTAYAILGFVSITFIHRMARLGVVDDGIFSSAYDITYFNMALPFLVFSISSRILQAGKS